MTKLEIALAYAKKDFNMFSYPNFRKRDERLGVFDISLNAAHDNIDGFRFYCDNTNEMNNVLRLMSHYKIPYKHTQEKIEYIYTDGILGSGDIDFISGVLRNIRG